MSDPTKVKVQFNVHVPWDFREFLRDKAKQQGVSQNQLGVEALMDKYGAEFARKQAVAPR